MPTPAPTELLNEDVKRLEESNQRIVARMDALEKTIGEMGNQFNGFRSKVNTVLAITSAVALLMLGSVGMIWTGVSSLQRELGRTEAIIGNFDKRFDELRAIGEKLNRVSEGLARLEGRLERDGASKPEAKPKAEGNP